MNTKLFFLINFIVFTTACSSSNRFLFFNSEDPLDDKKEFVFQNDTLDIRYRFSGDYVPLNIYIYNKSDKPIYVDWKKSAAIVGGENISYWRESYDANLTAEHYYYGISNIQGNINIKDRISYIAPKSYIETTRIYLGGFVPQDLSTEKREKVKMRSGMSYEVVERYSFDAEESPLWFRSRITLSDNENFYKETPIESVFWISEMIKTYSDELYIIDAENTYINFRQTAHKPGNISIIR